jgi:NTE family protein
MVFHIGALWRLHEAGLLRSVTRVSSVSGGSITAGVLALAWDGLAGGGSFADLVAGPVMRLASRTVDRGAIIGGAVLPGTISQWVADAYDDVLFRGATLQDLPDAPRFVINATNLETGALWRFSKPYMRDWRVGSVERPMLRLADAVAASSAFPPVLSPYVLDVDPFDFAVSEPGLGDEFRRDVSLTDGGVYDNLGLETAWKSCRTLLVSDGGGRSADDASPPGDWAQQAKRVLDVVDGQVRALRKRQLVGSFVEGVREGAYWGMRTDPADYGVPMALACPRDACIALAETPTRLKRMAPDLQRRLVNWGYAVTDAAIRAHVSADLPAATAFPFPDAPL